MLNQREAAAQSLVLDAVKQNGGAFAYADPSLRADRGLALEAVKRSGLALQFASETLRHDKELVMQAVEHCGFALQFVPEKLRADVEIALKAVRQNGEALKLLPKELRANQKLVLEALKSAPPASIKGGQKPMATFLDGLRLVEKKTFLEVVEEKEPQGKVKRSMSWHDGDSKGMYSCDPYETETATSASDGMGSPTLLASTSNETPETPGTGEIHEIKQLEQVEQMEQVYIPSHPAPASAIATPSTMDPMQAAIQGGIGGARGHAHAKKACKPCVFAASRAGCANTTCEFCHDHQPSCSGRRPRKETRERCKEAVESVFTRQMDFSVRCQILQAMAQQSPYMRGIIVGRLDQE
eukprot:s1846_g7.t1